MGSPCTTAQRSRQIGSDGSCKQAFDLSGKSSFNEIQYRLFLKDLDEYRTSQEYVADFPAGRYNLGNYYSKLNDLPKAEENYREAIAIDNLFYPAKSTWH